MIRARRSSGPRPGRRLLTNTPAERARSAARLFHARKVILLEEVAAERRTGRDVLDALEVYFAKLTREFLRVEPAAYGVWHELGPRGELLEVRDAYANPTAWKQLVAKCGEREGAKHV